MYLKTGYRRVWDTNQLIDHIYCVETCKLFSFCVLKLARMILLLKTIASTVEVLEFTVFDTKFSRQTTIPNRTQTESKNKAKFMSMSNLFIGKFSKQNYG